QDIPGRDCQEVSFAEGRVVPGHSCCCIIAARDDRPIIKPIAVTESQQEIALACRVKAWPGHDAPSIAGGCRHGVLVPHHPDRDAAATKAANRAEGAIVAANDNRAGTSGCSIALQTKRHQSVSGFWRTGRRGRGWCCPCATCDCLAGCS